LWKPELMDAKRTASPLTKALSPLRGEGEDATGCFGQFHPEAAPFAGFGFEADGAAHSLGGFLDNRKANASPLVFVIRVNAAKNLEDTIAVFGRDADALVFHPDADVFGNWLGAHHHFGRASRRDEFAGVDQEVGQNLGEHGLLTCDG